MVYGGVQRVHLYTNMHHCLAPASLSQEISFQFQLRPSPVTRLAVKYAPLYSNISLWWSVWLLIKNCGIQYSLFVVNVGTQDLGQQQLPSCQIVKLNIGQTINHRLAGC